MVKTLLDSRMICLIMSFKFARKKRFVKIAESGLNFFLLSFSFLFSFQFIFIFLFLEL